jgi:sugar phosphate permease
MSSSVLSSPAAALPSSGTRWLVALVLCASVLTGYFDRISIAVLFTNADFTNAIGIGFDPVRLGLLMTAFLLAYGASSVFLGSLGDLLGPRLSLGVAAGVWGVLMLVMGATSSYAVMIGCRILLGLFEGPQFALLAKVVKRWFPPEEQGRGNALWMMGAPLGSAIGFPLTIWLVASYGWRASFYSLGLLSLLVVMPLIFLVIRNDPPGAAAPETMATKRGSMRADLGVLARDSRFWLIVLAEIGVLVYLWGLTSWLPTYLDRSRHLNLRAMGIFASLPFILTFAGELASGVVSDWLGKRALVGFVGLIGAGILMYAGTRIADPYMAATAIAFSSGMWGFAVPSIFALATNIIPPSLTSTGIGVINGVGNLVGSLIPPAMGLIIATTGSYDDGLLVLVGSAMFFACMLIPLLRK